MLFIKYLALFGQNKTTKHQLQIIFNLNLQYIKKGEMKMAVSVEIPFSKNEESIMSEPLKLLS